MPAAVGQIWNDGRFRGARWRAHDAIDDVGYLLAVIDQVIGRQAIDPARIYVVGMSNGATMAGRLAWEHPERIGAIAQVAGTVVAEIAEKRHPTTPLPLLQIHGTRDRIVPYDGGRSTLWARVLTRGPASRVLSVDEWARRWVERNRTAHGPVLEAVAPDVTVRRWHGPSSSSDVAFYRVDGGGHTWPGARLWMPPHLGRLSRSIDATRVSWEFLSAHRRLG